MKLRKKRTGKFFTSLFLSVALLAPVTVVAEPETPTQTDSAADPNSDKPEAYFETIQTNEISGWPEGPAVYAQSAVVMEAATGAILYAKNMDQQLYPASITKLMTTLLALENSRLDERVTFSKNAIFGIERDSSHIGIRVGEILSMEDCLYGIMLESANEVCMAVAEHISGSVEEFAKLMTQRAKELGCKNTNFVNPNGLPDENHYTSAYDMALIAQAVYAREDFREITGTLTHKIGTTNVCGENRWLLNHHKMMQEKEYPEYFYSGITGGKTGYTQVALNTLVTYANRNDTDLICVTMKTNGRQVYLDTAALLDYGFSNFHKETLQGKKAAPVTKLLTDTSVLLGQPWLSANSVDYIMLPNDMSDFSIKNTISCENYSLKEILSCNGQTVAATTTSTSPLTEKLLTKEPIYSTGFKIGSLSEKSETEPTADTPTVTKAPENTKVASAASAFAELPSWKYAVLGLLLFAIILYVIMLVIRIRRKNADGKN